MGNFKSKAKFRVAIMKDLNQNIFLMNLLSKG